MDRSGSMMAGAGGGRTKMDMANLGAAGAMDMLTSLDEIAVIAVDSQPHIILAMQYADEAQSRRNDILGIRSMGGGIFVEEGITAGLRELSRASAETKHLILFADAADAEEPGDFRSYLAKATAAGITVSVIGLGTESDCDAKLLREIAEAGNGTCQFESNAKEIPRLFMQDTYLVAKTAMCTNLTPVKTTSSLRQLSDVLPAGLSPVGGYNLTYIRDDAETAIFTEDDEHAPVLAFRRAGAGRTLAFTGEMAGKHAAPLMTSKDGAEIATAVARWTLGDGETEQSGFHFERRVEAGGIRITAVADEANPLTAVPNSGLRLVTLLDRGGDGVTRVEDALRWESSDTLSAFVPLYGNETAFPIVTLPDGKTVALAPACLPHPAEFHRHHDPAAGERAMRRLSERTKGRVRTAFDDIWDDLPAVRTTVPLAPWIYTFAAFAFLASVFVRRLGAGVIYRQSPKAGATVKKGRSIFLTINSIVPRKVVMPNLIGYSLNEARAELNNRGLALGKLTYTQDIATNNVLRQTVRGRNVRAGDLVVSGSDVDLTLGLSNDERPTAVPRVIGMKYIRAVDALHDHYLNVGRVRFDSGIRTYADSVNAVVYQQDALGQTRTYGTAINLYLTLDPGKLPTE